MALQVNSYITLDTYQTTKTFIDITPNFEGRVGNSESFASIWFKNNGMPWDLTSEGGITPYFAGVDPNGNPIKIVGSGSRTRAGDDEQLGRVTFVFPAGTFQVEGDWDKESTFFGLQDNKGMVLSSVNVYVHVLANKVDFGINTGPFYTELQDLMKKLVEEWNNNTDIQKVETEVKDALSQAQVAATTASDAQAIVADALAKLKAGNAITQEQLDTAVKALASLTGDNTFSGSNTFTKTIIANGGLSTTGEITTANGNVSTLFTNDNQLMAAFKKSDAQFIGATADFTVSSPFVVDKPGVAFVKLPSAHGTGGLAMLNITCHSTVDIPASTSKDLGKLDVSKYPVPTSSTNLTPRSTFVNKAIGTGVIAEMLNYMGSDGTITLATAQVGVPADAVIYLSVVYAYQD